MTANAPVVNRLRRERSPRLLILPSLSLPPLEFCFGTSPIHAEKSLPDRNTFGSTTLKTRAVASTGPTLGRDEPHVRSGDRLTDRFGISGIVLMPLYIRFYIGRWHQANGVTECL